MTKTPLGLRWKRAQDIVKNNVPLGYMVSVEMENNILADCSCTCPDFRKEMIGRGIPHLRGIRVCKHALALALTIHNHI